MVPSVEESTAFGWPGQIVILRMYRGLPWGHLPSQVAAVGIRVARAPLPASGSRLAYDVGYGVLRVESVSGWEIGEG